MITETLQKFTARAVITIGFWKQISDEEPIKVLREFDRLVPELKIEQQRHVI